MELVILLLSVIIFYLIVKVVKGDKERYQPNKDLIDYIINMILYSPLETNTLIKIVNSYQGKDKMDYNKKFKDVIGFLRFTKDTRFQENFIKEARRYLSEPEFNQENLKYFVDGISSEIKAIQVQEDDLD